MSRATPSPTLIGSGIAFVLFLLTGAVPSLVYGGYAGLMVGGAFFGHGTSEQLGTRIMTGSGMVVGFILTLGFFLTIGALVGRVVGATLRRRAAASEPTGEAVRARADRR
ncbi:hypothetical protein L6V77_32785 [Myxococcota bacterium]|nr:hypothetical protein [Myxococcota bacterium]